MKISKRLISAFLAVILVITSLITVPVFAAEFTDLTSEHNAYDAVNVLNKLGVINGYEDGSFKPDNNVTRAEFTAMLLRTRGMGSMGSTSVENPPFPDVVTSDVSWAIGNIRTAQGLGIINGYEDGTFRPKNNVSYEEAVKMIVCALGYENFGTEGNTWYAKYIMTANTLGFLDKTGGAIGTPATRATIAKMLYNCLEINLAENNEETTKNILENDLKLKKKVGMIASNNITSLYAPDTQLRENEIVIEAPTDDGLSTSALVYKVDNAAAYKDMFGAQITFYYKEDKTAETRTVILATVEKSKSLTINAKDLVASSSVGNALVYYENDDAKEPTTVTVNPGAYVIYNDKLYGNNAANSVYSLYRAQKTLPTVGSIKLLDREGDGTYDVVFVDDYTTYVVSSLTISNYTVVDSIDAGLTKAIKLDPNENNHIVKFVDAQGKETNFNAIRSGNVISVKESNSGNGGKNYVTVEIRTGDDAVISGTIKGIVANKNVVINGEEYGFSPQATWSNGGTLTVPVMDVGGKFYLDKNGDIYAYDKDEVKSNQYYGYLIKTPYRSSGIENEELYFDIVMLDTGNVKRYSAYDDTKINDVPQPDYTTLRAALQVTPNPSRDYNNETPVNNEYSQLIKFTTTTYKNKEVIDNIITATDTATGATVVGTALTYYTTIDAQDTSLYRSSEKKMYQTAASSSNPSVNIGTSTKILLVSNDRTDENGYKALKVGDLRNNLSYYAEYYDVSATSTASVVLVYSGVNASTAASFVSPYVVITSDLEQKQNNQNEGEIMWQFTGYDAKNNSDITGWVSPSSEATFANVKKGDVVRLGTDNKGFYTLDAKHILFGNAVDRAGVYTVNSDGTDGSGTVGANGSYHQFVQYIADQGGSANGAALYRAIWGSIHAVDDDFVNVSTKIIDENTTAASISTSDIVNIPRSTFSNTRVYRYSSTNGTLTMTKVGDDGTTVADTINSLPYFIENSGSKPAEVFVYMQSGSVKLMIIKE